MNITDITPTDLEIIARYSGGDRSWRDRLRTKSSVAKYLSLASVTTSMAIVSARYESRCEPRKGDNHG